MSIYLLHFDSFLLDDSSIVCVDCWPEFIPFTVGEMHGMGSHLDDTARSKLLDFASLIS
jgi:hypothetical protein